MPPQTRYAKSGDVHIAYQSFGEGDVDLVYLAGIFSHIELQWEQPLYARFLNGLGSFARLITLDTRGTGLSDRAPELPLLEEQMDDVTAVLDAVGSERAAILGVSQSGPMAALFAATYPRRTEALVLYGTYASARRRSDYPWGRDSDWVDGFFSQIGGQWGHGSFLGQVAPSMAEDPSFRKWWGRLERYGNAPGNALAFAKAHTEDDVRHVLGAVSAPTLVLQRTGDVYRDAGQAAFLADQIPDATLVRLSGADHPPYVGDQDAVLDEIEMFLTGTRSRQTAERVLATVMFTDIVGSTDRAVEVGDRRWRELLQLHDATSEATVIRHRGRFVDSTGDGILATFDGPARAIRCALELRDEFSSIGLPIRCGLHTGEIELSGDGVAGIAVHTGARIADKAQPGEVLASRTVKDLVAGSAIEFDTRGTHELKGIPDSWQLFAVG